MSSDRILDGKDERDELLGRKLPVCSDCINWEPGTDTCTAFPIGIPDAIFIHGDPHRVPFPSDGGIHFEPIKGGNDNG